MRVISLNRANVILATAQYERRLIGQRTCEALAANACRRPARPDRRPCPMPWCSALWPQATLGCRSVRSLDAHAAFNPAGSSVKT